ncbi:hypothetical protein PV328_012326, partial [Microctonus aethiopoides]
RSKDLRRRRGRVSTTEVTGNQALGVRLVPVRNLALNKFSFVFLLTPPSIPTASSSPAIPTASPSPSIPPASTPSTPPLMAEEKRPKRWARGPRQNKRAPYWLDN